MMKTYLLAFLLPTFIYVLFSSVMFRFLYMNTFSQKTIPEAPNDTEPFLPVGIGLFIALLLPLFLFSEYFGGDIFVFSVFALLILLTGLLRDVSGSTLKMSKFLQFLILILFAFFSETGYLIQLSILQNSLLDTASNVLLNATIYWFVLNAVRVFATSSRAVALFAIVLSGCGLFAFSSMNYISGIIYAIAMLGTFVPYLLLMLRNKTPKNSLGASGTTLLGFSLLFMAIQLGHNLNLVQHETITFHPIIGIMGIFFLPIIDNIRLAILNHKKADKPNPKKTLNILSNYKKKMLLNDVTASVLLCAFGGIVALALLVAEIKFMQALYTYIFMATIVVSLPELYRSIGRTITGKANERPMP